MSNLSAIIEKIRALRAKAADTAATEAEAQAAAEMAAKLLERYDLEESQLTEKSSSSCTDLVVRQRAELHPVAKHTCAAIAHLTQTIGVIWEKEGALRFYGVPHEVELAVYLSDMLTSAAERCSILAVGSLSKADRGKRYVVDAFRRDFFAGFTERVNIRLVSLARDRSKAQGNTGKALVVAKNATIEEYLREQGIGTKNIDLGRLRGFGKGYEAGRDSGESIHLGRPISARPGAGPMAISA